MKKIFKKVWYALRLPIPQREVPDDDLRRLRIQRYMSGERIPWSEGYEDFKYGEIERILNSNNILNEFKHENLPKGYGKGIDERIVEYPWIFANLPDDFENILDAGSTFNFPHVIHNPLLLNKNLCIYTYYPEEYQFTQKRISYFYGDLRDTPFKNNFYDVIVSQSTIEHIDMDNSIYGYEIEYQNQVEVKSYDYMKAISEMERILKPGGVLLLTFPFGKFENHGFFQQFDLQMLNKINDFLMSKGNVRPVFFSYEPDGWIIADADSCEDTRSYNPHTGRGKGNDGAAHCRSICCVKFIKGATP